MRYLLLLLIPLLSSCASPSKGAVVQEPVAVSDEDRIVRDLCDKRIALLGEEGHHGNARTIAFKAALIRRLVEECHYDAFYIETGPYDFLHLQAQLKAGQPVSEAQVAAAIGGMWANQGRSWRLRHWEPRSSCRWSATWNGASPVRSP